MLQLRVPRFEKIYDEHFSNYLLIGSSGFNGGAETLSGAIRQGEAVGADVVIVSSKHTGTHTSVASRYDTQCHDKLCKHELSKRHVTTYGTNATAIPVTCALRSVCLLPQECKSSHQRLGCTGGAFPKTATSNYDGKWKNVNLPPHVIVQAIGS